MAHWRKELKEELKEVMAELIEKCSLCGKHTNRNEYDVISHMGQTHNFIEKYLPEDLKI
jgi:hypothetical protein